MDEHKPTHVQTPTSERRKGCSPGWASPKARPKDSDWDTVAFSSKDWGTVFSSEESEDDGLQSDTTEAQGADDKPLEAGSLWPHTPNRAEILDLARLASSNNIPLSGVVPNPTAEDVARSAIAAVRFLRSLGSGTIDPSKIGIDNAGRLFFDPGSCAAQWGIKDGTDFRDDFDTMVSDFDMNFEENLKTGD